jgi:8-oxo-dGTP pyrophosphatase MutT (NUDIX family)
MQEEASFGVIPLSNEKGHWEVFLIQHRRGGHWGFPKGRAELNETSERAAMRELKEETNLDIVRFLSQEPLHEKYHLYRSGKRVSKMVLYYLAEVEGDIFLQQEEIEEGAWFTLQEARTKLTHSEGRAILTQVEKILSLT